MCSHFDLCHCCLRWCSSKENPHNERFVPDDLTPTNNDSNTSSNEDATDDESDEEETFDERNFVCSTNDAELSTNPRPKHIMVGDQGNILLSDSEDDIEAWVPATNVGSSENLNAVAVGTKVFIAVGDNGTALCSPNGWDWFSFDLNHESDEAETEHLYGVTTNGNQFLIVGANGAIYTHLNNTEWSRIASGQLRTDFMDAVWGRDMFIVIGGRPGENAAPTILFSKDAVTWTVQQSSDTDQYSVARWSGEEFWIAGYRNAEDDCSSDCYSEYLLQRSQDGFAWTTITTEIDDAIKNSRIVTFDADQEQVLAIGRGDINGNADDPAYFSLSWNESTDSWLSIVTENREYREILYTADDAFVLTSSLDEAILFYESDTGTDFDHPVHLNDINTTKIETFTVCPASTMDINRADAEPDYYGSRYVLVGSAGNIYSSHKGDDWELANFNVEITADFKSIVRTNNSFYAVGDEGTIACSRDGIFWNQLPSGTDKNLTSIATDGNRLVAVGEEGIILTSANGIQWDHFFLDTPYAINRVRWINDMFVALAGHPDVDANGFILKIFDPFLEDLEEQALNSGEFIQDITWAQNRFYAVGYEATAGDSLEALVLTSVDAESWLAEIVPDNPSYIKMRFDHVSTRGNEVLVLGKGFVTSDQEVMLTASNQQVVSNSPASWHSSVFTSSATPNYHDILQINGTYFLVGDRGVLTSTDSDLNDVFTSVIEDFDVHGMAVNLELPAPKVGELYTHAPIGSDIDGQRLEFTISNLPDWAEVDRSLGMIYGTPDADDFDAEKEREADKGPRLVQITVAQDTKVSLSDHSEVIEFVLVDNRLPIISGSPQTSLATIYNESYYFAPTAYDLDGEILTFDISVEKKNGTVWEDYPLTSAWLNFETASGILYGLPSRSDEGSYRVNLSVSDGVVTEPIFLDEFIINVVYYPEELPL